MEWHRSEPREVRPFFTAQKAEAALNESSIRLTLQGEVSKDTSFELDDSDLRKLEPVILPDLLNPQIWMPEGLSAADLDLLVVGRQSLFKRSRIVARYSLAEQIPDEIEVADDVLQSLGGGRNAQFTLAVVLSHDREPQPGSPFVRGHWLAQKTFHFRTRSTPMLFDIRPRTDEEWVANGYPAKTLYAVEYLSGIESPPDDGPSSIAVVHIHSDAHARLADTKLGDAFQPLLGAEIITNILQQSVGEWEQLDEAPSGSGLDTVMKQLKKVEAITLAELATQVKTQPSRVRALIQSRLGVTQALR